jgi:serine/threonine protein phosphatase PrpC
MAKKTGSEKVLRPVFGKPFQYVTESSYHTTVDIQGESHAGHVRPVNEDSFLVISFSRNIQSICTNLPPSSLPENYEETGYGILVADGLGGRPGGDVASKLAISELIDLCIQTPDWIMRPNAVNVREVLRRMKERFGKLADALAEHATSKSALLGMGTT